MSLGEVACYCEAYYAASYNLFFFLQVSENIESIDVYSCSMFCVCKLWCKGFVSLTA